MSFKLSFKHSAKKGGRRGPLSSLGSDPHIDWLASFVVGVIVAVITAYGGVSLYLKTSDGINKDKASDNVVNQSRLFGQSDLTEVSQLFDKKSLKSESVLKTPYGSSFDPTR